MNSLSNQLSKAIAIATERHEGQFDKAGMPYILHCLKVMHYTKSDDLELMAIAVMHDLIEDTFNGDVPAGIDFLSTIGFTQRIINGVVAMTKTKGLSHQDYKNQIRANHDAVRVKMADLRHNTDIRRLKGITQKDIERTAKYYSFYQELKELLSSSY